MDQIHGVTFRDYACACANQAGGMELAKICEVLGVEDTVWGEIQEFWNNKMAELSMDDMAFYGEVFTNPKQGKFANVEGGVAGVEEVLEKYPEWDDYIKMEKYMEHASAVGIDIDFDKEFGISITQYSQLAMHWSGYFREKVMDVEAFDAYAFEEEGGPAITPIQEERERVYALYDTLRDKWDAYYKEKYKDQGAGLSDDIDF